jgi:rubrerythrin
MADDAGQALKAIKIAMESEKEAHDFYAQTALKTSDPKGKDLLLQLAAFEENHYSHLEKLFRSLEKEHTWISYEGIRFGLKAKESPGTKSIPEGELNILRYAIEEEKKAEKNYRDFSERTDDALGKEMFRKLSEEEALHARVLNDQLVSLANKGVWVWGD